MAQWWLSRWRLLVQERPKRMASVLASLALAAGAGVGLATAAGFFTAGFAAGLGSGWFCGCRRFAIGLAAAVLAAGFAADL